MGIPGLTSYINSIETLWTSTALQNTRVVIDGSCFTHYLYISNGLDCRCGGQYREFYNAAVSFFNSLTSKGVEPLLVFDGTFHPSGKKSDTVRKRAEDTIQKSNALSKSSPPDSVFLLPPLSKLVLIQALRDRNINFAICDSEADNELASLASTWNCPVLSSDSDFFIFDIKAGYIPLTSLNYNSDRLTVSIFHQRDLASYLRLRKDLVPLWACLLGNDYVTLDTLMPFNHALKRLNTSPQCSRKAAKFLSVANFLCKYNDCSTVQSALELALEIVPSQSNREALRKAVEFSLQEYTITESNLVPYFESSVVYSALKTQTDRDIVEWVLRKFREALFPVTCMNCLTTGKNLLRVQVEKCSEKSANHCSLFLRRFIYGILKSAGDRDGGNILMIQEWGRDGLNVQQLNVAPYDEVVLPSLKSIPDLAIGKRSAFVLTALDSDTAYIESLPERLRLVAASLRFLISRAQPAIQTNHLLALLCSCVKLDAHTFEPSKAGHPGRAPVHRFFDLDAAHSFAQWQCVLRDALYLNYVLLEPLITPFISKVYDGQLAQEILHDLKKGLKPEELLPSLNLFRIFFKLYNAITDENLEKLNTGERKRKKAEKHKSGTRATTSLLKTAEGDQLENRFALLCSEEPDCEGDLTSESP